MSAQSFKTLRVRHNRGLLAASYLMRCKCIKKGIEFVTLGLKMTHPDVACSDRKGNNYCAMHRRAGGCKKGMHGLAMVIRV